MRLNCPTCSTPYPPENINVQTDVAHCPRCNTLANPSALMAATYEPEVIATPPPGAWYREEINQTVVGASTRSVIAFFLVPFMCVWSGFSLGGIYGTQIVKGEFNLVMSLFGIPFLLGSLLFWSFALMAIWGKVEVRLRSSRGTVFTGVGSLGWKRHFNLADIDSVEEGLTNMNYPGKIGHGAIVLSGKTSLTFGSNLKEARRHFVLHALRAYLAVAKKRI